jgi:sialic acid synthase SpsE
MLAGPDHAASLEPHVFASLTEAIRTIEQGLGTAEKRTDPVEADVRIVARRSLVVARGLTPDRPIVEGDLIALRPGDGVPPERTWDWLGRSPSRSYRSGELFHG